MKSVTYLSFLKSYPTMCFITKAVYIMINSVCVDLLCKITGEYCKNTGDWLYGIHSCEYHWGVGTHIHTDMYRQVIPRANLHLVKKKKISL